ncbi:MAG: SAM-dependent methyltransferase [Spirochaetia bacterium]|nr:SAM-dependent methyltransferase [Spirochaetia bacterium]MCE1208322.1 SAM-dependent methyltransferase [Spirochaetia bacterium]MDD3820518.1 SAM-dependent methyltransferase [Spirochaetales bacterium]NLX45768.1 SAM-dependent methyltransferase [Treponema sp.]HOI21968.1 SAM-dependent methyltransferase [Spirochaetales bacterium]
MSGRLFLLPAPLAAYSPEAWSPETLALHLPAKAIGLYASLDSFIVESERSALRLLSRFKDAQSLRSLKLRVLNEHSGESELPSLLEDLEQGMDCGFLSEAGMPCIADPGAALVAYAREKGVKIIPVSGPSSILLGLVASGLDAQRFAFLGYLPQNGEERRAYIARMATAVLKDGMTRVCIETPYRNKALLKDLIALLPDSLWLCVASDLCGAEERVLSAPAAQWRRSGLPAIGKVPAIFLFGKRAGMRPPDSR